MSVTDARRCPACGWRYPGTVARAVDAGHIMVLVGKGEHPRVVVVDTRRIQDVPWDFPPAVVNVFAHLTTGERTDGVVHDCVLRRRDVQ